jgi:hypothetical protein
VAEVYKRAMSIYLTRRDTRDLTPHMTEQEDVLFVNQRFDGQTLRDIRFSHCTFANVSFKNASLVECDFLDCVFEGCYFRNTQIRNSRFPACHFIACEFVKPLIVDSMFGYSRFDRTLLPYSSIESSLPGPANVCHSLTSGLAVQAASLGHDADARSFRLKSIAKREEALWMAVRWADDYSRTHYPTSLERLSALAQLALSRVNGFLWGYGESMRRLVLNILVVSTIIWPLLYLVVKDDIHPVDQFTTSDAWLLSLSSILSNTGSTGIRATGIAEVLVLAETALGFLFFGLFVAYLFRAVTRRSG